MADNAVQFPGQAGGWQKGTGSQLQVIVEWSNPETGESVLAPDAGWRPPEGSNWEVAPVGREPEVQNIPTPGVSQAMPVQAVPAIKPVDVIGDPNFRVISRGASNQEQSAGNQAMVAADYQAMQNQAMELSRSALSGGSVTDLWKIYEKERRNGNR